MRSFLMALAFKFGSMSIGTGAVHRIGIAAVMVAAAQGLAVAGYTAVGIVVSVVAVFVAAVDFRKR